MARWVNFLFHSLDSQYRQKKMDMAVCTCNPSAGEESWGILWLHSLAYVESSRFRESSVEREILFQKIR